MSPACAPLLGDRTWFTRAPEGEPLLPVAYFIIITGDYNVTLDFSFFSSLTLGRLLLSLETILMGFYFILTQYNWYS